MIIREGATIREKGIIRAEIHQGEAIIRAAVYREETAVDRQAEAVHQAAAAHQEETAATRQAGTASREETEMVCSEAMEGTLR